MCHNCTGYTNYKHSSCTSNTHSSCTSYTRLSCTSYTNNTLCSSFSWISYTDDEIRFKMVDNWSKRMMVDRFDQRWLLLINLRSEW